MSRSKIPPPPRGAAWETTELLKKTFEKHKAAFPVIVKRHVMSPAFSTLLIHAMWCSFFDRSLIRRVSISPIRRSVEPGKFLSCILLRMHHRFGRDNAKWLILRIGTRLIPVPEEWLVL